jgi:LCP family protein required for cell wall assembly
VVAALVAVALVVVAGAAAWVTWHLDANITKVDVSAAIGTDRPTPAKQTKAVNILLIGSDKRTGAGNETYGKVVDDPGTHSDTNLIVHLSADRTRATVVSIPRDSMTPAPPKCSATAPKSQWVDRQWNHNFSIGGAGCLIRTIEGNTGLFIDHYAIVDFGGFKNMVTALGGVQVCTTEAINDSHTHLVLTPGRHQLDGEQALAYVRTRKSVGDGSDLGRIKRQQAFLSSVAQKATSSRMLFQPTRLYGFLDAATTSLTTDPGFGLGTMEDLASSIKAIGLDKIQFVTVPNEAYAPDPNRVQWKASARQIWTALREDRGVGQPRPSVTPSPSAAGPALTVPPDQATVHVVNASGTPGLARQAAAALAVQGFAGVTTANGPAATTPVLVEYSGDHAEAAATVAAAFPGAIVEKATGLGSTVRVTLGVGAPDVVEVPNRLGTKPLPTPSISPRPSPTESIETRKANTDICS